MNVADLKTDLLRKINELDEHRFVEAYGVLSNFINSGNDELEKLTPCQQEALQSGIDQLDNGLGKNHVNIIAEARAKYSKAPNSNNPVSISKRENFE